VTGIGRRGRVIAGAVAALAAWVAPAAATTHVNAGPDLTTVGDGTSGRAVVVIEGGGSTHPFTTPWTACDDGRPRYVQALRDARLPVFTAPGYTNTATSTTGRSGCPPQPPIEVQWNTSAYPTQAGESVLGFLG
jgi:hypothetical protein